MAEFPDSRVPLQRGNNRFFDCLRSVALDRADRFPVLVALGSCNAAQLLTPSVDATRRKANLTVRFAKKVMADGMGFTVNIAIESLPRRIIHSPGGAVAQR